MTEHKANADYHRSMAQAEVTKQGKGTTDWSSSRATQMHHEHAAHAADRAHAAQTNQTVVYTPVGTPVFRPKGY